MNTCASIATLETLKDCDAAAVRAVWRAPDMDTLIAAVPAQHRAAVNARIQSPRYGAPALRRCKRIAIDVIFGTHGVEYLGQHKRNGRDIYYCNAGDAYAPTIAFCGPRLFVTTWGDIVESGRVRQS